VSRTSFPVWGKANGKAETDRNQQTVGGARNWVLGQGVKRSRTGPKFCGSVCARKKTQSTQISEGDDGPKHEKQSKL